MARDRSALRARRRSRRAHPSSSTPATSAATASGNANLEQCSRPTAAGSCSRRRAGEPTPDDVADARREAEVGDGARNRPGAVLEAQLALFDEMQQRLAQEERVAVGLRREHRRELLRHRVLGECARASSCTSEVSSPDRAMRVGSTLALQDRQPLREGMPPIDVGLTIRADHEDPAAECRRG